MLFGRKHVIRTLILSGAAVLSLAAVANAQPMNAPGGMPSDAMGRGPMGSGQMGPGQMGDHTMDFVTKAAQSDEFERREGRLAEMRSHNPHVKQFAAMMVKAHTKTTMDLKRAIHMAGMTPPPPPMLTDDQMQMMASLKSMHGRDFDKTYIDQQVQAHQMTLEVMQGYAQNGRPGPIKDAAQQTTPLVQHHLDMAKDIQGHMGG
jgi:putative membrane protein